MDPGVKYMLEHRSQEYDRTWIERYRDVETWNSNRVKQCKTCNGTQDKTYMVEH